ncbi:hypothetical protein [Agrobacterium rosae]|uniref:Uncharacterized protein n=1 Tax=Agrobacterium rosae TaxID=1972867 RepID=A0AAW9FSI6_9HYPH|nr:hypothetical protein [Agrobacterium rosae]MDX8305830.1 hypothetical protein [Agrobacterium rosae]
MKILVMLAGWAGDDSENTREWLEWYREILATEFSSCEIFLAVSNKSDASLLRHLGGLANISRSEAVNADLHVDSDASQYQLCLRMFKESGQDYDLIFFMHTKGISYSFEMFKPWRESVRETIFSMAAVESIIGHRSRFLVAERGHMIQAQSSISQCRILADECGILDPTFHYAAATTLFYVDGISLKMFTASLPPKYFCENLLGLGHSRFFFEGTIPSLLTMMGAEPLFVGGSGYEDGFNQNVSFDALPAHNSALVLDQYRNMRASNGTYKQNSVPYVTGTKEQAQQVRIFFEL